jgi:hypothetical protein
MNLGYALGAYLLYQLQHWEPLTHLISRLFRRGGRCGGKSGLKSSLTTLRRYATVSPSGRRGREWRRSGGGVVEGVVVEEGV